MAVPLYYSAEMVRALPEDRKRYETVHGELLVTPARRRGRCTRLCCNASWSP